jgi:hypothetical protein
MTGLFSASLDPGGFVATRRSIFFGVVVGEVVMLAGKWWLG